MVVLEKIVIGHLKRSDGWILCSLFRETFSVAHQYGTCLSAIWLPIWLYLIVYLFLGREKNQSLYFKCTSANRASTALDLSPATLTTVEVRGCLRPVWLQPFSSGPSSSVMNADGFALLSSLSVIAFQSLHFISLLFALSPSLRYIFTSCAFR